MEFPELNNEFLQSVAASTERDSVEEWPARVGSVLLTLGADPESDGITKEYLVHVIQTLARMMPPEIIFQAAMFKGLADADLRMEEELRQILDNDGTE